MHTALCNDLLGKSELLMMAEIIASQRASPLITTNNHEPYEPHGHYEPHKPHGTHGPIGIIELIDLIDLMNLMDLMDLIDLLDPLDLMNHKMHKDYGPCGSARIIVLTKLTDWFYDSTKTTLSI